MTNVNNFFRQTGKDDTIEPAYMKMMSPMNNDGGDTADISTADFNALKTRVTNVENKASVNSANISALQPRTSSLESSQTEQNNRLDTIEEQLNSFGTTDMIIEYITSVIGKDVPSAVSSSPERLAQWLAEQDTDGIDLNNLSERIDSLKMTAIGKLEIEAIVNS